MIKIVFYFIFSIFSVNYSLVAQNFHLSGQIKDLESKEVVPYATVVVLHKLAAVADDNGKFDLLAPKESIKVSDTLVIQSLGYETQKIQLGNLAQGAEDKTFFLKSIAYPINEVTILPHDEKKETIWLQPPFDPKKCNFYIPYAAMNINKSSNSFNENSKFFQHAIRFIPETSGQLLKVKYYISKKGKQKTPFRVRIYERNPKTKLPGKDLLQQSILTSAKRGNEWVEVDLSRQQIEVDTNGFFVAIEPIYDGKKGYYSKKVDGKEELNYGFVSKSCSVKEGIYCTEAEKEPNFSTLYCLNPKNLTWSKCMCSPKDSSWHIDITYIPLIGAEVGYD